LRHIASAEPTSRADAVPGFAETAIGSDLWANRQVFSCFNRLITLYLVKRARVEPSFDCFEAGDDNKQMSQNTLVDTHFHRAEVYGLRVSGPRNH
jgi:hypothetical protein